MKKLLTFEFRKLFKQKSTYICLALFVVFAALGAVVAKYLPGGGMFDSNIDDSFGASITIANIIESAISPIMAYPLFLILLSVFIPLYVCGDRSNGTIKNVYSKGYSRGQLFFAKYIVSLTYVLAMTLMSFIVATIVGLIMLGSASGFDGKLVLNVFCQFLLVIGSHALIFCFSSKLGKSAGSIAINVLMQIFVPLVLMMLDLFVSMRFNWTFRFSYLFPTSILSYMPAINVANDIYIASAVTSVVYTAIFLPLGFLSVRKKEY